MTTRLEQMPDKSDYYAVLHGPVVLAAKTNPFPGERINYFADDSRMGHIASGPVCPLEQAPVLVSDSASFAGRFRPVPGRPLTFTAPGLVQAPDSGPTTFLPFFRVHDARYVVYWPYATPAGLAERRAKAAADEKNASCWTRSPSIRWRRASSSRSPTISSRPKAPMRASTRASTGAMRPAGSATT
jgi:hypothetical protein